MSNRADRVVVTRSALDRTLLVLSALYVADLAASIAAAVTGFRPVDKVSGPVMVLFGVVAVGFAVRAAWHPGLDRRTRRAWRAVAGAFVLALATPMLFFLVTGNRPFPQPGDGTHLAFGFLLAIALQLFPLHAANRRDRWKTVLDATTVAAGASMLLWYVVIGPALEKTEASAGLVIAAAAYPVVDLLALFGFARVLLRGIDRRIRRPLWILAVGFLALYIGDAYLGYMQAHSTTVERTPWQFVCWLSMHFLLAAGAVDQCRQAAAPSADPEQPRGLARKLPYAGIGLGYGLMAAAALHESRRYPWTGLVMGGMVITGVVMLRQSLSQRESDEAAATDTLTGLPNRGRLNQVLARALDRAARSGQRSAVLLIDLNGFKQINDTLGHQVGDGLLTAVADAMRRCVRGGDLIGRLGGDEFAVVLPVIGGDHDAMAVAERITDALAEPVVVGGEPLQASASIGAAVCEPGELTPDALLHRADVAMYVAKRGKRHRPELWTPGVQDAAADDESLEADLGRALAAGQLSLCYQPLVDMVTGEIAGVEALARWHHPVRGEIGPAVFIPVAERTGAIDEIGRWVLEQAASQAGRWRGPGRTPYLSVNLSPRQLDRPDLVPAIRSILDRAGLDPRNLVLELTETALVQENSDVDHLRALRELGIRIAIDDFGIGYSSLRYLTRLPVDILKLDGCFTAELNGQPSGSAVAEAVLRLGQSLGLDVVAEGVETAGQANELTVLGYRIGQGYRFAYPMTADDVADRVAADRTAVQDR